MTELREGNESLLDDDNFHEPESDHWWEHETFWWQEARSRQTLRR